MTIRVINIMLRFPTFFQIPGPQIQPISRLPLVPNILILPEPVTQHEIIDLTTTPTQSQPQVIEASFSSPLTMPELIFTGFLEKIDLGISPKKITPLAPRFNHLIFSSKMRNLNKTVRA